jgi:hypothetical protein
MATLVEKTKIEKKITYSEAIRVVKSAAKTIIRPESAKATASKLVSRSTEVGITDKLQKDQSQSKGSREITTQTEDNKEIELMSYYNEKYSHDSRTIPKWAAFMIQIMTIKDIPNHKDKCTALLKSLEKILNIKTTEPEVEKFLTPPSNGSLIEERPQRSNHSKNV